MFRQRRKDPRGRSAATGSIMIDVRTRFASCRRIAKATGVYPNERNAKQTVEDIKAMIREFSKHGDEETPVKIHTGKLTLLDALKFWRQGRIDVAYGDGHTPLLAELQKYNATARISRVTRRNFVEHATFLEKKGFVDKKTTVGELPQITWTLSQHFAQHGKADRFNGLRSYFLGFVTKHLKHKKASPIYSKISEIPQHAIKRRKPHNPFESPRDMYALLRQVDGIKTIPKERRRQYKEAIYFMCLHGLRPHEYAEGLFTLDESPPGGTGHLRIQGSKNVSARRVVPLFVNPAALRARPVKYSSLHSVLLRTGAKQNIRDFRRTYAIWLEKAGIPESRARYYMGHQAESMTQHYRTRPMSRQMLDEDEAVFRVWFQKELDMPTPMNRTKTLFPLEELMELEETQIAEAAYRALAGKKDE